jgi:hypothetical protein
VEDALKVSERVPSSETESEYVPVLLIVFDVELVTVSVASLVSESELVSECDGVAL